MNPTARRSRHGWTIVELLVVLGILMLSAALALPAVQDARNAARRVTCQARLADLGTATGAHVAALGRFPKNKMIGDPQRPKEYDTTASILVPLLPHLDRQAVYDAINWRTTRNDDRKGGYWSVRPHPANETAARVSVAAFLCPADAKRPPRDRGPNNYRGNTGYIWSTADTTSGKYERRRGTVDGRVVGIFGGLASQKTRPKDVTDGLSHTVLFSEKPKGFPPPRTGATKPPFDPAIGYWTGGLTYRTADELVVVCSKPGQGGGSWVWNNTVGDSWMLPGNRFTTYTHDAVPNSSVPDCSQVLGKFNGSFAARSLHPGGVYAAYADGHVDFVEAGIDREVWRAAGSRAGGEVF